MAGLGVFLYLRNYIWVKLLETNCVIDIRKVALRDTKSRKWEEFCTVLYIYIGK